MSKLDRIIHELLGVGALALVHIATAVSFARIFSGWGFLPPLLIMVVCAHTLSALLRLFGVPFTLALPILAILIYTLIGYLALNSTLRRGLPLSATWSSFTSQINDSWLLLGDVVPPLSDDSGFGIVALLSVGFAAVLADAFAFRFAGRAEAFAPATVIFVVVAAVGIDRHRVVLAAIWIATALGAVAILRARDQSLEFLERPNAFGYRPAVTLLRLCFSGVLLASAIGFGALTVGPLLPGANDEAWLTTRQSGDTRVLEPLVDVRRRLSSTTNQILFTVAAERSSYWRLTALPVFNGSTWTVPASLLGDAGGELAPFPDPSRPGIDIASNQQRLSIDKLAGSLLPVSYAPVQLRAASRSLFYETQTGSVVVGGDGLESQDTYEFVSSLVSPRPEILSTASASAPPSLDPLPTTYLSVPDNEETRELRRIVADIVDPADSPYAIALDLQSYFRDTFTYSLDVPADVDGAATLAFLERGTGYCEQFSSTFALFARLLGIPARVAVGFTPGEVVDEINGQSVYEVRSQHAHAWPELWFDGIGWVLFEPTPGRGAPNAEYTNVPVQQDDTDALSSPQSQATTTTSAPPAIEDPSVVTTPPPGASQTDQTMPSETDSRRWGWLVFLVGAVVLWLIALRPTVRWLSRRHLTGTLLDPWRQVVALYEFQRGPFNPTLSPTEIATVATSRLWDDDPFIIELSQIVTEMLYSGRIITQDEYEKWTRRTEAYLTERIARLPRHTQLRIRTDPWVVYRLTGGRRRSDNRIQG